MRTSGTPAYGECALKHHFWNRDHVLRSMLPGRAAPFR